jgi:hypothetical protein
MALSQGGWLMPLTALSSRVGFAIVVAGSAVSLGEESLYSTLTGDDACAQTGIPLSEVRRRVAAAAPSKFDPRPYLARLEFPFSGCTEHSTRASRSTRTSPS